MQSPQIISKRPTCFHFLKNRQVSDYYFYYIVWYNSSLNRKIFLTFNDSTHTHVSLLLKQPPTKFLVQQGGLCDSCLAKEQLFDFKALTLVSMYVVMYWVLKNWVLEVL